MNFQQSELKGNRRVLESAPGFISLVVLSPFYWPRNDWTNPKPAKCLKHCTSSSNPTSLSCLCVSRQVQALRLRGRPVRLGPQICVHAQVVQDQSGQHFHHRASQRTRQGSFQQQQNRFETVPVIFVSLSVGFLPLFCSRWLEMSRRCFRSLPVCHRPRGRPHNGLGRFPKSPTGAHQQHTSL